MPKISILRLKMTFEVENEHFELENGHFKVEKWQFEPKISIFEVEREHF